MLALLAILPQGYASLAPPDELGPCERGFQPTCEQARGFGLCMSADVIQECPHTCASQANTSGHLLHNEDIGLQPSDYTKPLVNQHVKSLICDACKREPEQPCCHNHPHSHGRQLGKCQAGSLHGTIPEYSPDNTCAKQGNVRQGKYCENNLGYCGRSGDDKLWCCGWGGTKFEYGKHYCANIDLGQPCLYSFQCYKPITEPYGTNMCRRDASTNRMVCTKKTQVQKAWLSLRP